MYVRGGGDAMRPAHVQMYLEAISAAYTAIAECACAGRDLTEDELEYVNEGVFALKMMGRHLGPVCSTATPTWWPSGSLRKSEWCSHPCLLRCPSLPPVLSASLYVCEDCGCPMKLAD
jgi:hypothetical protein